MDGLRIARPQGQSGTKTVDGSNIHQWQGVLLPTCGNNLQEDLHHDGRFQDETLHKRTTTVLQLPEV